MEACRDGRLEEATQTLVDSTSGGTGEASPVEPCLQPGDVLLERFRVQRLLARGGMGEVYEVEDSALGVRVALKKMRTSVRAHASALALFRREVLLARRVTHPNVCRLFEFFTAEDAEKPPVVFLTMELLEGRTLSEHMAREGKLGETALPLVRQMVAALSAAHREGVVHRDFKSSNVILGRASDGSPRVVVTDFGLACGIRQDEGGDLLRHLGMVGSPLYMAPEQVTGAAISRATDVYALGVVLYEMVTGTFPFVCDTPLESAYERLKRPPEPPSSRRPGLNPAWNRAILRCLEINPARRFASVEDLLLALGEGPLVRASRRRFLRRTMMATGLAVLGLVGGAGAHLLAPPRGPASVTAPAR